MSNLNLEALRRIEDVAFDHTQAYDRRLIAIQGILHELNAMMDAQSEEDYRAYEQSFKETMSEHI